MRLMTKPSHNKLKYVDKHYHTKPEHLWEKYPTSEILRHKRNRKWYALITDVNRNNNGRYFLCGS